MIPDVKTYIYKIQILIGSSTPWGEPIFVAELIQKAMTSLKQLARVLSAKLRGNTFANTENTKGIQITTVYKMSIEVSREPKSRKNQMILSAIPVRNK